MKPSVALVAVALAVLPAFAADPDPASLYEVTTQGSTDKLKSGEKGVFVLQITSRPGAYVSEEAPLKLEVAGKNVRVEKTKLTLKDSVAKKVEGKKTADPRFEIPVVGEAAGPGAVDGKLTFFICTEKLCARQQKMVSVPVEVL